MLIPSQEDQRHLSPQMVVRVDPSSHSPYRGLLAVLAEVGDEYVSAMIHVEGEDPVLTALPRGDVAPSALERRL